MVTMTSNRVALGPDHLFRSFWPELIRPSEHLLLAVMRAIVEL
jgi:hypothetical protein